MRLILGGPSYLGFTMDLGSVIKLGINIRSLKCRRAVLFGLTAHNSSWSSGDLTSNQFTHNVALDQLLSHSREGVPKPSQLACISRYLQIQSKIDLLKE